MSVRIQLRRDTAANWASTNPTLTQGEPGYETDTGKIKYGDGSTAWNSLGYSAGGAFAAGSASSPSITFTGDTNTGIYSPGADQLAISSSGSERIRIGANGEIGLSGANYGTSGQVLTSAGSGAAPTWTTPSAGNTDKIEEGNSSAEVIDTGSDGRFVVTTEGTERLRVDSSGRLGLGSSVPDALLTVNGVGAFGAGAVTTPSIAATGDLNTGFWFPAADTVALSTGGSEAIRVASTGALGLSGANYGSSGQVLTSQGSGAAPQWATPAGGSFRFIGSVTASNSTSVAFTSGINDTYSVYVIIGEAVVPSTDTAAIHMRYSSNGGSSYINTNYVDSNGATFADPEIEVTSGLGNATGETGNFRLTLFNLRNSYYKLGERFSVRVAPSDGTGSVNFSLCGLANTSTINAIQFYMSSGNISTGTFRLYGISNS